MDDRGGQKTSTVMVDGLYEQVTLPSGVVEHKYFVGDAVVTKRTGTPAGDALSVKYLLKDHLGSTIAVVNDQGVVVQQFIYDPWGKQYNVYSNANLMLAYSSDATTKGYTGHEMVTDFDVIHMGGRTYNPVIGRFMQADPHIQFAGDLQSYNRYSYVMNNPMKYTDPTGYFLTSFLNPVKKVFRNVIRALGPEVSGMLVTIGSAIFCGPAYAVCVAAGNYEIARAYGVSPSGALRVGVSAGVIAHFNPAPTPGLTDVAIQGISIVNPNAGRVLRFTQNGIDTQAFKESFMEGVKYAYTYAAHEYMNAKVGAEVARFARRNGMTLNELNALLTLNSVIGNKLAGSRYHEKTNEMSGFTSRRDGVFGKYSGLAGVIWDINDTILGYQGLMDASGNDYIHSDNAGKHIKACHSLGTITCNNLVALGHAPSAQLNSLPFGNVAVGSNAAITNLGQFDIVNGGWLGRIFNPFSHSPPCLNGGSSGLFCHGWDENYRKFPRE